MIEILLITNFVLTMLLVLLMAAFVVLRSRYVIDTQRIADLLAARILDGNEAGYLDEQGTRGALRERYMHLVVSFGMPASAVDAVTNRAWRRIEEAQGTAVNQMVEAIYS